MPEVTVCVPAWQAADFIDRTLRCARSQTFEDVRIMVSVDRCEDATAEICHEHARADSRVQVIEQPERLGWARNANALLDLVETDLFFLYFHDDVLEPTYVERLRDSLLAEPDALSAHCDLQHFGGADDVLPGVRYDGPAAQRLLRWLVGPVKGTTLRSLTRRSALVAGLRFPVVGEDSFWRAWPYHLMLAGLGPAVHVPEILYRRWVREGSVTKTWQPTGFDALVEGLQESAVVSVGFVRSLGLSATDEAAVLHGIYLHWVGRLRSGEGRLSPHSDLQAPERLLPALQGCAAWGAAPASQPEPVRQWLRGAESRLERATQLAQQQLRRRAGA
jgi:glycosyltransferase involved in cell wall biosynthesis